MLTGKVELHGDAMSCSWGVSRRGKRRDRWVAQLDVGGAEKRGTAGLIFGTASWLQPCAQVSFKISC